MIKQKIPLINYYRNYHIYSEFGKRSDLINNKIFVQDFDELQNNLVDQESISSFFIENEKWCTSVKKFIYKWAVNFSHFVKLKYGINENYEHSQILKFKVPPLKLNPTFNNKSIVSAAILSSNR